jgi:hypothetical protein
MKKSYKFYAAGAVVAERGVVIGSILVYNV